MRTVRKKRDIIAVLVACALASAVSAMGVPIVFDYKGNLDVTMVESEAGYNNEFGIFIPPAMFSPLGNIQDVTPIPHLFQNVGRCEKAEEVVMYIKTPANLEETGFSQTYTSNVRGPDGKDHVNIIAHADGSFRVAFEDSYYNVIDEDTGDVVLHVACRKDPVPIPEFPALALPAALIVGILGAVLVLQRTKEN
jgi:hypothetical protein